MSETKLPFSHRKDTSAIRIRGGGGGGFQEGLLLRKKVYEHTKRMLVHAVPVNCTEERQKEGNETVYGTFHISSQSPEEGHVHGHHKTGRKSSLGRKHVPGHRQRFAFVWISKKRGKKQKIEKGIMSDPKGEKARGRKNSHPLFAETAPYAGVEESNKTKTNIVGVVICILPSRREGKREKEKSTASSPLALRNLLEGGKGGCEFRTFHGGREGIKEDLVLFASLPLVREKRGQETKPERRNRVLREAKGGSALWEGRAARNEKGSHTNAESRKRKQKPRRKVDPLRGEKKKKRLLSDDQRRKRRRDILLLKHSFDSAVGGSAHRYSGKVSFDPFQEKGDRDCD